MRPIRFGRLHALVAATCTLALTACSSSDASPAATPPPAVTDATEPASSTAVTEPVTVAPTTTAAAPTTTAAPTTVPPEIPVTADEITAALEIDPGQLGEGFVVAPPDAPDMAAKLEQSRVSAAASTEACGSLRVLTSTPEFSRVYATAASDVVTVHVFVVDPPSDAPAAFDVVAGNVDQLAECLLAIGSAGLDTFFGAANATGITGGAQRLVGSVAPPAAVTADGAVAFDSKTDLEGATPFTIDGKFIVFRVGALIVTVEGGSPVDATGPADHAAEVVAERLATVAGAG